MTELCDIAFKYRTDKCPQIRHSYTIFYYELLKDHRNSIKKVLEMGVGYRVGRGEPRPDHPIGRSLYMWRDFFPNAQIYGADIVTETVFKDGRIETFLCDETKKEDLAALIEKTGSDIDLFIDDGSHITEHQIFLCQNMMPLLKKDVIYIIEDVKFPPVVMNALSDYDCFVPKYHRPTRVSYDNLIIVRRKEK